MTRPLRIGLLAEGKTELGNSIFSLTPQEGGKIIPREKEGALHTLIRRELDKIGFACDFVHRHPQYPSRKKAKKPMVRQGYTILERKYLQKRVIAWKPQEVDVIIIVVDADNILEERQKKLESALETIRDNHLDINEKPINDKSSGGLAIQNFETWLLADSATVEKTLGVDIPRLNNLEDSDKTKRILENAITESMYLSEYNINQRRFQIRWDLAKEIDLAILKKLCPQGSGQFIKSLLKLIQEEKNND